MICMFIYICMCLGLFINKPLLLENIFSHFDLILLNFQSYVVSFYTNVIKYPTLKCLMVQLRNAACFLFIFLSKLNLKLCFSNTPFFLAFPNTLYTHDPVLCNTHISLVCKFEHEVDTCTLLTKCLFLHFLKLKGYYKLAFIQKNSI